jgi:hypothetical protein
MGQKSVEIPKIIPIVTSVHWIQWTGVHFSLSFPTSKRSTGQFETTGNLWKFLRFKGDVVSLDLREYPISELGRVIGIIVTGSSCIPLAPLLDHPEDDPALIEGFLCLRRNRREP